MTEFNNHVPNCSYMAEFNQYDDTPILYLGSLVAADPNGILAAVDSTAGATTLAAAFASAYSDSVMGTYGRNVTVVAAGAYTGTVTVNGHDYLGQPVTETLTGNGTTAVAGVKIFHKVTSVTWTTNGSTTVDVGWGDVLGLPCKALTLITELVDDAAAGTAGTFTAGTDVTVTATSSEPRGKYAPHSSEVPDGSKVYKLQVQVDKDNLHGVAQYAA